MRLIDADALKVVFEEKSSEAVCGVELCKAIISRIDETPTIDTMPFETLHNFIRKIGAITYGKERFFYEDGVWYDRESCEWVTTQTAIEACLKAVRELDDGVLDAVPVIRCRDCVEFRRWDDEFGECYDGLADGGMVRADGYCYAAERKKDDIQK